MKKSLDICVVGAGTMGRGIVQVFAQSENNVTLVDLNEKLTQTGFDNIKKNMDFLVDLKAITPEQAQEAISRVTLATDLSKSVQSSDLVVETVPENLDLKRKVLSSVETYADKDAILASNTSSLRITEIASVLKRKGSCIGTHFINPAHVVPIVEVVPGENTSRETLDTTVNLLAKSGKKPVIVKEVAGFVHNRLICALLREAMSMVAGGITNVEGIDTIVKEAFGPRFEEIGIFGLEDNVGLDVLRDVSNQVFPTLDNSNKANSWLTAKIESGDLGVKSGRGFYSWTEARADSVRKRLIERFLKPKD